MYSSDLRIQKIPVIGLLMGLLHWLELGVVSQRVAGHNEAFIIMERDLIAELSIFWAAIGSSTRNRPADERSKSAALDVTDLRDERVVGEMISAEEAARRILDGVDRNDPYIMTHAEGRPYIARRFGKIDKVFEHQHPESSRA